MASLLPTLRGLEEEGLVIFAGLWSLAYVRRTPTHSSLRVAWAERRWYGTGHAARRGGGVDGCQALDLCTEYVSVFPARNISNNTKSTAGCAPLPSLPLCPCKAYSPAGVSSGHTPSSSSPAADGRPSTHPHISAGSLIDKQG